MNLSNSRSAFQEAQKYIPGGVNSPVRAFKSVGGSPVFFQKAEGAILTDIDNHQYIDYVGSWGPMILGHNHPKIVEAIQQQTKNAISFGAPTEIETKIAKLIVENLPHVDLLRMVNSGTEATMSAIRLARGYTKKEKIIKFEGCYHGHADSFLIKAGSGGLTLNVADSLGVTKQNTQNTLIAQYNNIESVKECFKSHKNEIAAIIIEPIAGNMGVIPAEFNFLQELRKLCNENGSILIFDEVMTGFRIGFAGATDHYKVVPDLITFGKVIGGGLPVGAYGGKKEIMSCIAPLGGVYQAGTLSGNPISMTAGLTTLQILHEDKTIYSQLEENTKYLVENLYEIFKEKKLPVVINTIGSMFSIFFTSEKVVGNYHQAINTDKKIYSDFFHFLLKHGIYIAPSPFESFFISIMHDKKILDKTLEVCNQF